MKELLEQARVARLNSYSPYSKFKVGAALLTTNNQVYTGCNIESVSYTPTCCAERTAFVKALSEGARSFKAIAIVGGKEEEYEFCYPCGVCRQFMSEFCDEDFIIYLSDGKVIREYTLNELFPHAFKTEI